MIHHPPSHRTSTRIALASFLVLLGLTSRALAHPGHGLAESFTGGISHPFTGLDHLAAMTAVGVWASLQSNKSMFAILGSFITAMVAGALVGFYLGPIPGLEQFIAMTVLVIGLLVATVKVVPASVGVVVATLFAVFHGIAHGAETPFNAQGLQFGAGFLTSTALLLLTGVVIGKFASRHSKAAVSSLGWATVACSLALLMAMG